MKRSNQFEHHEFADKVEARERRGRRRFFFLGLCLWFLLSCVPAFLELRPKWRARVLARRLSEQVGALKRTALARRATFVLSLESTPPFQLRLTQVVDCNEKTGTTVAEETLIRQSDGTVFQDLMLLSESSQSWLQLEGLKTEMCFSALKGYNDQDSLTGFGFISKDDYSSKRLDRMSIVLLEGNEAQAQFD